MYRVVIHDQAQATVDVLPAGSAVRWPEVLDVLELTPWTAGEPWSTSHPQGNIRTLVFGDGAMATYMVLERDREVHVLEVYWAGD